MPLDKSGSKESIGANIKREQASGKSYEQSLAIALSTKDRANGVKYKDKNMSGCSDESSMMPSNMVEKNMNCPKDGNVKRQVVVKGGSELKSGNPPVPTKSGQPAMNAGSPEKFSMDAKKMSGSTSERKMEMDMRSCKSQAPKGFGKK